MVDRQESVGTRRRLSRGLFLLLAPFALLTGCGGGGGGSHAPAMVVPSASLSTVDVTPGEGLDADGVDYATVVITVRDAAGHLVPDVTATIAASGSNNVLTQPFTPTNPVGATSGRVAATTAGARTLTITLDPAGANVTLTSHPIARFGTRAKVVGPVRYLDANGDAKPDPGDSLVVTFDQAVTVASSAAASFSLPVAGDTLGTGATVSAGPLPTQVSITLGTNASFRTRGLFVKTSVAADAPSGLDVSATIATGAIVDVASGQTVAADANGAAADLLPGFAVTACLLELAKSNFITPIDYNRDDLQDAVILDEFGLVTLFQNDGPGAFTDTNQSFTAGSCVAVGDMDGDGDDDLIVGVNGQPDRVYRNVNGNFTDTFQLLGNFYTTTCIALADVDGDGNLDLIEGCVDSPIHLYLNDGSGVFTETPQLLGSDGTTAFAVGDVDGDGSVDIVAGGAYFDDQVFLNDGAGNFTATGLSFHLSATTALALADLDHDGALDVVAAGVGDAVTTFLNDGAGHFAWNGDFVGSGEVAAIALRDVDGDGDFDLLTGGTDGFVVFEGLPGGHLSALPEVYGTTPATGIAVADWSHDGDPDVLTFGAPQFCVLYQASLTGTQGAPKWSDSGQALGAGQTTAMVAGDVDGDGDLDYVQGVASGTSSVWLNDGGGNFTQGAAVTTNAVATLALGDIDRDGDLDLLAGFPSLGGMAVYVNDGSGNFTDTAQTFALVTTMAVALGDLNGDGDLDLVQGDGNGPDLVLFNDGSGVFTDSLQGLGSSTTRALALGDVDGDGDLDLVEGNASAAPEVVWKNDGFGVFTQASSFGADNTRALLLVDVDGDHDLDVVVGNSSQTNTVWLNNGTGTYTDTLQSLGSGTTLGLVAVDLDLDGDVDYLDISTGAGTHAWLNNGDGIYTDAATIDAVGAAVAVVGDLDIDGDLDVVVGAGGVVLDHVKLHD